MSTKNNVLFSNESMSLVECPDGYWLYDKTRGMNLAMRAKTEVEAYQKALGYYHKRFPEIEEELRVLRVKVKAFVAQFIDDEGDIEV